MENYIDFLDKYIISIPPIQRDYVQGLDKNSEKRDAFIKNIFTKLLKGESLNLRFIYGTSYNNSEGDKPYFTPIDGQQRITTLVLTIWLVTRCLEKQGKTFSNPVKAMNYSTRNSTKLFINHLLNSEYPDLKEGEKLSDWYRNVPNWFAKSWENDPSITAMLEILDKLDDEFRKYTPEKQEQLAKKLTEGSSIIFDFLDMEKYGFTEDLYVKMNARGKHLTEFENWKAEFYGFLKERYGSDKAEEFSNLVEGNWTNLYWNYAISEWKEDDKEYPRIDEYFMRFYSFITEMLYLTHTDLEKLAKEKEIDVSEVSAEDPDNNFEVIYNKEENIDLLFNAINAFCQIQTKHKEIKNYFEDLLIPKFNPQKIYDKRVSIFTENVSLFDILIKGGTVTLAYKALLYALIKRIIAFPGESIDDTINYIRVIWGVILSYNQRLAKTLTLDFNFRVENMKEVNEAVDEINKKDVFTALQTSRLSILKDEQEKSKYRELEKYDAVCVFSNLSELKGVFRNVWHLLDNNPSQDAVDKMLKFLNEKDDSKVTRLVSCGFNGAHPKSGSYHFFGVAGHWDYVLSADYGSNKTKQASVLEDVIDGKGQPKQYSSDTFEYYYLKYPEFRNSSISWKDERKNYFYIESPFKVWALAKISSSPMGGYNCCPYAYTVVVKSERTKDLGLGQYSWWSNHGTFWSDKLGFQMECVENGWKFTIFDKELWEQYPKASLFSAFIDSVIPDAPEKDRIETAVEFLKRF